MVVDSYYILGIDASIWTFVDFLWVVLLLLLQFFVCCCWVFCLLLLLFCYLLSYVCNVPYSLIVLIKEVYSS